MRTRAPCQHPTVRITATLLFLASAATLACSDEDVWYHVEHDALGLAMASADRTEDTCHVLLVGLSEHTRPESVITGIDINVDGVVVSGLFEGTDARSCRSSIEGATRVENANGSGHIRLEQVTVEGFLTACRVEMKVDVGDVRFRAKDLFVWNAACEPVPSDTIDYTNLSAAYSQASKQLTIAGWDSVNQACGWVQFEYFGFTNSPLDVPSGWRNTRPTVSDVEEEQCNAQFIVDATADTTNSMGLQNMGAGTLTFVESRPSPDDAAVEIPCVIEIDAWFQHFATYYWVPERVGFSGTLDVAGACP